jgi:hypothetical protein
MPALKPQPPLTSRLPRDVSDALTKAAEERGVAKNVLVVEAVRVYLSLLDRGLRVYQEPGRAAG